jgi:hypothetical protein
MRLQRPPTYDPMTAMYPGVTRTGQWFRKWRGAKQLESTKLADSLFKLLTPKSTDYAIPLTSSPGPHALKNYSFILRFHCNSQRLNNLLPLPLPFQPILLGVV